MEYRETQQNFYIIPSKKETRSSSNQRKPSLSEVNAGSPED